MVLAQQLAILVFVFLFFMQNRLSQIVIGMGLKLYHALGFNK